MHGYIEAYTVALHYGWILGNGFHGVNTSSRKCLQLFMWAKIVFGTLFACESIGMIIKWLSHSSNYINDGLSIPAAMIMWYIIIQCATFYYIQQLRSLLHDASYDDTLYLPGPSDDINTHGGTAASGAGFNIWSLSQLPGLSSYTRRRAIRAAVITASTAVLLQIECVWLVWIDNGVDALVHALNYGLHGIAIVMYSYYFSVQSAEKFHVRRLAQMVLCVMFAGLSLLEMMALSFAANGVMPPTITASFPSTNTTSFSVSSMSMSPTTSSMVSSCCGWTSGAQFVMICLGIRTIMYLAAAYSFHSLKFKSRDRLAAELAVDIATTHRRICCIRWRKHVSKKKEVSSPQASLSDHQNPSKKKPHRRDITMHGELIKHDGKADTEALRSLMTVSSPNSSNHDDQDNEDNNDGKQTLSRVNVHLQVLETKQVDIQSVKPGAPSTSTSDASLSLPWSFTIGNITNILFLATFASLSLLLVIINGVYGASPDILGIVVVAGGGSSTSKQPAYDIGGHSMAFGIAFHFCFMVSGYSLRGLQVTHSSSGLMM
jgi:hypothetical protein